MRPKKIQKLERNKNKRSNRTQKKQTCVKIDGMLAATALSCFYFYKNILQKLFFKNFFL